MSVTPPSEAGRRERRTAPVTRTQIVRFAGAGGDFNPMHHDEPFAVAAGQPGVFAMGQLTAALLADAVAVWFGAARVARLKVRFRDKVWPGDVLVLTATPAAGDGDTAATGYELAASRESDGVVVASGAVELRG